MLKQWSQYTRLMKKINTNWSIDMTRLEDYVGIIIVSIMFLFTLFFIYNACSSGKKYEFYLNTEISSPTDHDSTGSEFNTSQKTRTTFTEYEKVLNNASRNDEIVFHINGDGGDWNLTLELVHAIRNSKANTIAIVETRAQSGHAYIALSTKKLVMRKNTYIMLHNLSGYPGDVCNQLKGTFDRSHDAYIKCRQDYKFIITQNNIEIDSNSLLTPKEKDEVKHGYNVYLTNIEINKRQSNFKNAIDYIAPQDPIVTPDVPKITFVKQVK